MIGIMDRSFSESSWDLFQAHVRDKSIPFTLCHGDFHSSNMFVGQDGRPFLFDWSEVGPWEPTADLVQIIISDLKPSFFVGKTKKWVEIYWQRLKELGLNEQEYSLEECWYSFCRRGPERWIWLFAILCDFPGVPDTLVQYFHDQLLAFIEAHGDFPYYTLKPVACIF